MAESPKPPPKRPPHGAFSSSARNVAVQPPSIPAPRPTARPGSVHERETTPSESPLPVSFPPDSDGSAGSEEIVLADIAANLPRQRQSSSYPPPLSDAEGHDAWTLGRMSRQSTVPPAQNEEVERLRALSARMSAPPPAARDSDLAPPSEGGALDLVDRSRPSQQLDLVGEMEELYALDDLTGALRFAELILGREPDNNQARLCAQNCRQRLIQLYASKIGDLQRVPIQALSENQMRWLGLDHRSGFLLSRVDGLSTVEEVLDVCGMPRLEALKTLVDLLERGAIRVQNR